MVTRGQDAHAGMMPDMASFLPSRCFPIGLAAALVFFGCASGLWAQADPEATVDFNRDIRPILSDRCFQCHGFDGQQRKVGLRLDIQEGLFGEREHGVPVDPGDLDGSLLWQRVTHTDTAEVMPPPSSGLSLTNKEVDLLKRWIEQGADYKQHWAFLKPENPEEPRVSAERLAWSRNRIDRFVAQEHQRQGLTSSPEADPATLVRRLALDITGLPPSLELLDRYTGEISDVEYAKLVDELLARPAYGERMAMMWLDVARYADTNGFHHDNERTAWPYRDWVIRAFQEDLPFDQFVTEQLAGDLLEEPTEAQLIATAFCRMHNINDEGGALDAEYRVEAVADRIETISTAFMGLTLACCRCHDHKYDPLTQEDYYSVYSFFNSVEERGVYPFSFEGSRAYPPRLDYLPPDLRKQVEAARENVKAAETDLEKGMVLVSQELDVWETGFLRKHRVAWADADLKAASTKVGMVATVMPDASVEFSAEKIPGKDVYTLIYHTDASDLNTVSLEAFAVAGPENNRVGLATNQNAVLTGFTLEAQSLLDPTQSRRAEWSWAWASHEQRNGDFDVLNLVRGTGEGWAVEGHGPTGDRVAIFLSDQNFAYEGGTKITVRLAFESGYGNHLFARTRLGFGLQEGIMAQFPTVTSGWWMRGPFLEADYDVAFAKEYGPERVTTITRTGSERFTYQPNFEDGVVHMLEANKKAAYYLVRTIDTPSPAKLDLDLGSDDGLKVFLNGVEVLGEKTMRGVAKDQSKVSVDLEVGQNILVLKIINGGGDCGFYYQPTLHRDALEGSAPVVLLPEDRRNAELYERFRKEFGVTRSPTYARLSKVVDEAKAELKKLESKSVPVLIMQELEEPTKTYVLARGHYEGADESRPVDRQPPSALGLPMPDGAPKNRLGFARWLTSPDHPLMARVHVNRIWQMLFGAGIVRTSGNFGVQSEWPSHLELLDDLAVRFMENGWSNRWLIREIVISATYRQSSKRREDMAAKDPANRYLWAYPRQRLPGEVIRDSALFHAGLLVKKIGGPPARPYQPPGLWRELSIGANSTTREFVRDNGENLYRRSLYTFWKRTSPNPQMMTFDAPTREFCIARRSQTNTPLQSLVLWNDEQFVEAARVLAARTMNETEDDEARIRLLYRRCVGRSVSRNALIHLQSALDHFKKRFHAEKKAALELLEVGEAPVPEHLNPQDLAAWTLMANTILSLDATIARP